MICYRDRTYCDAPCPVSDCDRLLTPDVERAARAWWGSESEEPPIAVADLRATCARFKASTREAP